MTRRRGRGRGRAADGLLTLALVALAIVVGAFLSSLVLRWTAAAPRAPSAPAAAAAPGEPGPAPTGGEGAGARAPGVDRARIRVEVLNAARVPGLADRVTRLLRSRGFDVVDYGNAPEAAAASVIVDRVGAPALAREVAAALPGTPIRTELSPERFIDVTLLVGRDHERFFRDEAPEEPVPAAGGGSLRRLRDRLGL